jgi:hypothetical protein
MKSSIAKHGQPDVMEYKGRKENAKNVRTAVFGVLFMSYECYGKYLIKAWRHA